MQLSGHVPFGVIKRSIKMEVLKKENPVPKKLESAKR